VKACFNFRKVVDLVSPLLILYIMLMKPYGTHAAMAYATAIL